ncbi:precorrin-3B synthase [Streptomyces triticagri]|nr:precorrin-3B synthase [Streptomyces triticagri]
MSSAAPRSSPLATAVARDSGDACPGAMRLHAADDGALARVRIPGGVLAVDQADALASAARRLGDGELHLTSRGNVQIRGLDGGCAGELAALLEAAGLLPAPSHERVRNVVASPLSGLDGRGFADVRPWLTGLDAALCASDGARELSGRFLFALDDGRGDVAGLGADVTVRATASGAALLSLGSSGTALRVPAADVVRSVLTATEIFLTSARSSAARTWRVDELPVSADDLVRMLGTQLSGTGVDCTPADQDTSTTDGPAPGVRGEALSVHVPLGRLSLEQWRELTRFAAEAGTGELRLTPWRGVVVPAPRSAAAAALARLAATGLVTDPASAWPRVGACIGRPGCAKSHADVRVDAARAPVAQAGLSLYWSGCERRCGRPRGAHADVVAVPGGGYRVSADAPHGSGRSVPLDDPSRITAVLAALTGHPA